MSTTMRPSISVYDTMPIVVPSSLSDLRGPIKGTVTLLIHLDWSPARTYDLADPRRVRTLYRTVIREATFPTDLSNWLNSDTLFAVWPDLVLPDRVRQAWEEVFPELAPC